MLVNGPRRVPVVVERPRHPTANVMGQVIPVMRISESSELNQQDTETPSITTIHFRVLRLICLCFRAVVVSSSLNSVSPGLRLSGHPQIFSNFSASLNRGSPSGTRLRSPASWTAPAV